MKMLIVYLIEHINSDKLEFAKINIIDVVFFYLKEFFYHFFSFFHFFIIKI